METFDTNWEKEIWTVIDNYFTTNTNYLSKTQLDSYNTFLSQQIPKTIRQFNPIKCLYNPLNDDTENIIHKFQVEFIIGGSCIDNEEDLTEHSVIINDGKGVYISKPVIQQKIDKEGNLEIIEKQLFPNEARLKNLTYKSDINCDIFVILTSYTIEGKLEKKIIKKFNAIPLGSVPIMLHSNSCVLSGMSNDTLFVMGECPYDEGGYFIIDGKEKVIVAQERQVENKLYIRENKNIEDRYNFELEIRSVPEAIFQPARVIKLYMINERFTLTEKIEQNTIRVLIPNINEEIPLFIIFRALGVISDKDILNLIIDNIDSKLGEVMSTLLIPTIQESSLIGTQRLALDFLRSKITAYGKNLTDGKKNEFSFKDGFLLDVLRNYFLPHVGKDFVCKSIFLGYMVKELVLTKLEFKIPTDRDSFINKRVDISGFLVGNIFRDLYFRTKNELEQNLNKFYYDSSRTNGGEMDVFWSKTSEGAGDLYPFFNIIDIEDINNSISIKRLLNRTLIDDGFMYTFKNCWGLKNSSSKCKEGVVQDLNRLNYLGYVSHIRRINITLSKSAKIRAPHSLHASSFGIICPNETPDGGNVGLRKNIAIMAKVTFGINSEPLYKILVSNNLVSVYSHSKSMREGLCCIFLNERLVGYHTNPDLLVKKLKLLRRNGLINIYTSIAWYITDNILKISTDSGRCCRPLLIVNNNTLALTPSMIDDIKNNNINWKHLVAGFRFKGTDTEPYLEYNDKYIHLEDGTNDYLQEISGVIEYIDTEEANTCLIAMTPHDLNEKANTIYKFTHCEIHPCMIWGVLANNVPLFECNQAPRNQFSCAQGKQSLGIYATNFKNRMDTKGQIMFYPQKPIIQSKMSKYLHNNELPHGINAIVAIGCFSGYNQEDSILFNKDSVQRGLFRTTKFKTYSGREELIEGTKEREIFTIPDPNVTRNMKNANYSKLNPATGLIRENVNVNENDILIGKVITTGTKDDLGQDIYIDNSDYVKRNEDGFVDKVYFNYGNDDQKYAKIRIRKDKIPEVGDKFASRFGQKGTIGMLVEARDMPFTKDGIVPDMIINPHAIPSRMTIGQLIEVLLGKLSINIGNTVQLTGFTNVDVDTIGTLLENNYNYERNSNEILYNGRTGRQLKVAMFIGPTFYQRLTHQVSDKFYSRNEGTKTSLTHQPVGGRAAGGGLRIGEMERDAILAHGASMFLKETMIERADKYKFYISDKSGLLAIVNRDKNIYEDFSNDATEIKIDNNGNINKKSSLISNSNFYCVEAPYAFKLFLQEIEAMGIAPRLIIQESLEKWGSIKNITDTELRRLKNQEFALKKYYETIGSKLSIPLLTFHDEIRSILYQGSGHKNTTSSIIDLSINRGQYLIDLFKANYTFIVGVDTKDNIEKDTDAILSAKSNLTKLKESQDDEVNQWAHSSDIEFIVADIDKNIRKKEVVDSSYLDNLDSIFSKKSENSFNTITLFNTIQHHFDSIDSVDNIFMNVKENIKLNGYFIMTCLDGELVYSLLKKHMYEKTLPVKGSVYDKYDDEERDVWKININSSGLTKLDWEELPNTVEDGFNNPITVSFNPITNDTTEYLVNKKLLINVASKFGLQIVSSDEIKNNFSFLTKGTGLFSDIYDERYPFTKRSHLENDDQIYKLGDTGYSQLKDFSNLFRYYIFKYQDDSLIEHQYTNHKECRLYMDTRKKIKINPRYIAYNQLILSAGDVSQLQKFIVEKRAVHGSGIFVNQHIKTRDNLFTIGKDILTSKLTETIKSKLTLPIYSNINHESFSNTLKYMFQHLKFGIFVKIKNGILTMFSPFFNKKYKNNYENNLDSVKFVDIVVDRDKYPGGIEQYYHTKNKYFKDKKSTDSLEDKDHWWLDNCIVNTFGELDDMITTDFGEFKNMLETLCRERGSYLSDCEFFINKQRFPYLRIPEDNGDIMEPYYHIFGKDNIKLENKYKFSSYMPILSTSSSDEFADILLPTPNDWNIVTKNSFPPDCKKNSEDSSILEWRQKQEIVFFKGSSAGCGNSGANNQRIKIAEISNEWNKTDDRQGVLTVILTKWDKEDKIYMGSKLDFTKGFDPDITEHGLEFNTDSKLNDGYGVQRINDKKYLLYIDSYAASYNYTDLMATNGLILKTQSINNGLERPYSNKLWYFDMLEPLNLGKTNYKTAHYIEINSNFDNLFDIIEWCKENDGLCEQIANNSYEFYQKYLNKESILDYLETLVNNISYNISNNSVIEDVFEEVIREEFIKQEIEFPNTKLKYLIGAKGKNIERIKRISDCKIRIDTKTIFDGHNKLVGTKVVKVIIEGKESGIDRAIEEIEKIAYQIEKKITVNVADIGKLIGRKGRHINSIKKAFSVIIDTSGLGDTEFDKTWTLIGIEKNIDCAIKAFDSLKEMNPLNIALNVCIQTEFSVDDDSVVANPTHQLIESSVHQETIYTQSQPVTDHKLGIIIPIYNTAEEDDEYSKTMGLNGGGNREGKGKGKQHGGILLEQGLINCKKIQKHLEKTITKLNETSDNTLDYKIFILWQKNKIIPYQTEDLIRDDIPIEIINNEEFNDTIILKNNRGALINSGVNMAINNGCNYVVIQDMNLIPNEDLIQEYYVFPKTPTNISSINEKYSNTGSNLNDTKIGILKISTLDYINSGGFPNDMWGEGYEDYIFVKRLERQGLSLASIINPGNVYSLEDKNVENNNPFKLNKLGEQQVKFSEQLYLSTYNSGIKQKFWYNIVQSNSIEKNTYLYHIELEETSLLPLINNNIEKYISSTKSNAIVGNKISVHTFVFTLLKDYIKWVFNYEIEMGDKNTITIDTVKILPPITDTFIDKNKSIIIGEIINKFTFIYNYIIYRVTQLLGHNSLLLTDNNDETKSKDYFIKNLTIDDKLSEDYSSYTINITYKIAPPFRYKFIYPIENETLTYQHHTLREIPILKIDEQRKEVDSLKIKLDEKYSKELPTIMETIRTLDKPEEIIGKYAIYYSHDNDSLYINDILEEQVINKIEPTHELTTYNIFLNTLFFNLKNNRLKIPKLYDELFGSIKHKLEDAPVVLVNKPSELLLGGKGKGQGKGQGKINKEISYKNLQNNNTKIISINDDYKNKETDTLSINTQKDKQTQNDKNTHTKDTRTINTQKNTLTINTQENNNIKNNNKEDTLTINTQENNNKEDTLTINTQENNNIKNIDIKKNNIEDTLTINTQENNNNNIKKIKINNNPNNIINDTLTIDMDN